MSIDISIHLSIFKLKARGRLHAAGGDEKAARADLDTAIEIFKDLRSRPGADGKARPSGILPWDGRPLGPPSSSSAFLVDASAETRVCFRYLVTRV